MSVQFGIDGSTLKHFKGMWTVCSNVAVALTVFAEQVGGVGSGGTGHTARLRRSGGLVVLQQRAREDIVSRLFADLALLVVGCRRVGRRGQACVAIAGGGYAMALFGNRDLDAGFGGLLAAAELLLQSLNFAFQVIL